MSLQRYTKSLSGLQRASLVEKSRQKPQERMSVLSHVGAFMLSCYVLSMLYKGILIVSKLYFFVGAGSEGQ